MASVSTWSGIRNKLENDYLCPALRGHIQYFATSYSKSADHEGRAAIRMDGVEVLRSNYYIYFENVWTKFHHLRSTTLKDCDSAKEAIDQAHAFALEQGTFDQKVFYEAFGIFDNQSIEKSLVSQNPLVRIFALLDRRLGKRHLLALEKSMEQELDWVRAFYVIRMQAEGLLEQEQREGENAMSQSTTIYEIDLNGRQYGMLEKMLCSARAEQLAANQLIDGDGLFFDLVDAIYSPVEDGWSTIEIVLEESHRELELLRLMTRAVYPEDEDYFVRQLGKRVRCRKDFSVRINLCR